MIDGLLMITSAIVIAFATMRILLDIKKLGNKVNTEIERTEGALKIELQNQIKQLRYAQDIKDMQMLEKIEQLPEELKEVIVQQLIIPQKRGF